jgi:DNA repair exonuclease SbcCD ATPase subunit
MFTLLLDKIDTLTAKVEQIDDRLTALSASVDQRFETLTAKVEQIDDRLTALSTSVDKRFETFEASVDKRFETFEASVDKRFETFDKRLTTLNASFLSFQVEVREKLGSLQEVRARRILLEQDLIDHGGLLHY